MNYADILIPDQRLVILRALEQDLGYSHNESILQDILGVYGHKLTRDQVRTLICWLKEQGLLSYEVLASGTYIATITDRGAEVATGRATVPGVKRPRPGE